MHRSRRQAGRAAFGAVLGALIAAMFAALCATTPLRAAEGAPAATAASPLADWRQTCRHYDNRARFLPRGAPGSPDAPFLARLADACLAALDLAELPAGDRPTAQAETLLTRLTVLRLEVSAINRDRVFGVGRDARRNQAGSWGAMGAVTATGEYLIARRIGVTEALEAMSLTAMTVAGR